MPVHQAEFELPAVERLNGRDRGRRPSAEVTTICSNARAPVEKVTTSP
ncbi:hypothetical protein IHE55_10120 [Streptomyces pactum]|uniref:Transposase n=1 Tax=Streptomyces pactum TaxID=68249 RepID=A0ABS0NJ03_9ACTN|nr:hypothetical protein [Streptomyces pactum]MBH5335131.1 hypothetical protein [Streptomyces pactum]